MVVVMMVIVTVEDAAVAMADHRSADAAHDRARRTGHDRSADRAGGGALGGVADGERAAGNRGWPTAAVSDQNGFHAYLP